jgi:hypothetical protein
MVPLNGLNINSGIALQVKVSFQLNKMSFIKLSLIACIEEY